MFPGFWQVMIILLIVLIFFGAGKLPRVMGDLAKGIKTFKAGIKDEEDDKVAAERHAEDDVSPVIDQPKIIEHAAVRPQESETRKVEPAAAEPGAARKDEVARS